MSYDVRFQSRLAFTDDDQPALIVKLRRGTSWFPFEARLDSGCTKTLFSGDLLEQIGWQKLPDGHSDVEPFWTNAGECLLASPIDVEIELESGERFDLTIFGAHRVLPRNLLGRDLLARGLFGLDVARQHLYVSSYRDFQDTDIFLTSTTSS